MVASFVVAHEGWCPAGLGLGLAVGLLSSGCMLNPDWDGCLTSGPCSIGHYCDLDTRQCLPVPDLPPELEQLPLRQWTAISRNVPADVDPCPARDCPYSASGASAVFDGWNGGVYASGHGPLGALVLWGAGGTNYHGNEVYAFDLAQLTWSLRSMPTDGRVPGQASTFEPDLDTCTWWDGAPFPTETYGNPAYAASIDAFVLPVVSSPGSGAPRPDSGCSSGTGFAFSLRDGTWSPLADALEDFNHNSPSVYDLSRDQMWTWVGDDLAAYSFTDDRWTVHYDVGTRSSNAVATLIPSLDLMVVADFQSDGRVAALSLSSPSSRVIGLTTTGDTEIESATAVGFSWSEALGAVVCWRQESSLYLLHPPADDWRTGTWRWERIEIGGEIPPTPSVGPYGRFQYIESLGVAVVATSINRPVYAVRLR